MNVKDVNMRKSSEDFMVELDGKLRSGRLGLQCEAIVGLPAIFDSHPFPTLVNASFLKMAEVFRTGSNFLRLCIVKVTQQCSEHLRKVHSANEVVRRFSATLHSNDPIARALALRELGALAVLTAEKVSVQQSVRQALEAHEKVEVDAAVYAARCLSAYNAQFAGSLVDKLRASVNGASITPDMQLLLLPTLQHVSTQSEAEEAKSLCVQLLLKQSSKAHAISAVHALSQLACTYIIHMSEHVSILVNVLERDARQQVCLAVLAALDRMASKAAHLWQSCHFLALWEFLGRSQSTCLTAAALVVMNSLAWSIAGGGVMDQESLVTCQALCCSLDCTVAALASSVATGSVLTAMQQPGADVGDRLLDAVCAVQTVMTVICTLQEEDIAHHQRAIQLGLSCTVKLAKACSVFRGDLLQTLVDGLAGLRPSLVLPLCRGIQRVVAVCSVDTVDRVLKPVIPSVVKFVVDHISDSSDGESIAVAVADLMLCYGPADLSSIESILSALDFGNCHWAIYCLARSAAQSGVFQLASQLFSRLSTIVCNDQHARWLAGLADLCTAEYGLQSVSRSTELPAVLSESSHLLFQATSHFGIAKCGSKGAGDERIQFVKQYCHLRSEMLYCIHRLLITAVAFKATAVGSVSIRNEADKCLTHLEGVSQGFAELYQSAFNADPQSLSCLRSVASSCDFLGECCKALYLEAELRPAQSSGADDKIGLLRHALSEKLTGSHGLLTESDRYSCLHDIIVQLLSMPVPLPPFVFNNHQGTQVKIALWPVPKLPEEQIVLAARTQLVLRVEGAVQQEGTVIHRDIEMVHIQVSSSPEPGPGIKASSDGEVQGVSLVKSLKPDSNSFSAEFVLHLVPDVKTTHQVLVAVSVSDTEGVVWTTGPRQRVRVQIEGLAPAQAAREALQA